MTADVIELTNGLSIEVGTADQRKVRGKTIVAAILDESAHWRDENSQNPAEAIWNALLPATATVPNAVIIAISSPHARKGLFSDLFHANYGKDGSTLVIKSPSWVLNPSLSRDEGIIAKAFRDDPSWANSEYGAEFRTDIENFVSEEIVELCTDAGVKERVPNNSIGYVAFTDPSGGSADAWTLGIDHCEGQLAILDALFVREPPFNPIQVAEEFSLACHRWGVNSVVGDGYSGQFAVALFEKYGIAYERSELTKSEIYLRFLPLLNAHSVRLLDLPAARHELLGLERRTTRNSRDIVDHSRGSHDDRINSVAGALVRAIERGMVVPARFLQTHAIDGGYDPLASYADNVAAASRSERRFRFSGPGWAPTLHESDPQQTHAISD
jgi:hypothetical protein